MLKALGRYEDALAAYKKVSRDFPQEPQLAEAGVGAAGAVGPDGAWGGMPAWKCIAMPLEQAERPAFRARMQAGLMSLLFDEGRYEEALAAHRFYPDGVQGVCGCSRGVC